MTTNPMGDTTPRPLTDDFLLHAGWVKALARQLLDDAAAAEDVAQDAWVILHRQPTGRVRNLPAWLDGVVRRLSMQRRAKLAQRQEATDAHAIAMSLPGSVREAEDARRAVVEAVLGLPEAYGTVVLMRYFDELSPREIAKRLGVPGSTVRTRLQRALRSLRETLHHADGEHNCGARALLLLVVSNDVGRGAQLVGGAVMGAKTTKWIGIAAGVLALVGTGTIVLHDYDPRHQAGQQSSTDALAMIDASPLEPSLTPVPTPTARVEVVPNAPVVQTEPRTASLHGTVIVLDRAGVEHPSESGTLQLTSWVNGMGVKSIVSVQDGRFEAPILPGTRFVPARARIRDTEARAALSGPTTVPADGCVEIRLRWREPTVVHVRDARNGRDLPRIEIVGRTTVLGSSTPLPPNVSGLLVQGVWKGDSPLSIQEDQLDSMRTMNVLFARADGYAWSRTPFDADAGGDVFLELTPSCSLDVQVTPLERLSGARIDLMQEGITRPIYVAQPDVHGRCAVEDIPSGQYTVVAAREKKQLASKSIVVVEGGREMVTLELAEPPQDADPERASISGVLVVPAAWKLDVAGLSAVYQGDDQAFVNRTWPLKLSSPLRTESSDTYEWKFSNLRVGPYLMVASPTGCTANVDVPLGGASGVRIEVPVPADVTVRVVEMGTKQEIDVNHLNWAWVRPTSFETPSASRAARNETTLTYNFRCPVGTVELSTAALTLGFEPKRERFTVARGRNELVLELMRAVAIRVSLQDEAGPIVSDKGAMFELQEVDGDGRAIEWSFPQSGTTVARVPRAGSYKLTLKDPLPGYLVPPDQIVTLTNSAMTEVLVRLTRKP